MSNSNTTDNGSATPEVASKKIKDGGFFARPHVRTDLGQPNAMEIPVRMPEDYAQIVLLDLGAEDIKGRNCYDRAELDALLVPKEVSV